MRTPQGDLQRELQDPDYTRRYGAAQAQDSFAILLAQARAERGLTQEDLAAKMEGWLNLPRALELIKALEAGNKSLTLGYAGAFLAIMGYRIVLSLAPLGGEQAPVVRGR